MDVSLQAGQPASQLIQPAALGAICHLMADMTAELWDKRCVNLNGAVVGEMMLNKKKQHRRQNPTADFPAAAWSSLPLSFLLFFLSIWFQINWYWLLVAALRRTCAMNQIAVGETVASPHRLNWGHILPSCVSRTVSAKSSAVWWRSKPNKYFCVRLPSRMV